MDMTADKELSIRLANNGSLEFDCPDGTTGEQLGEIVNELADTYCGNIKCLSGREEKCELCMIGDACHSLRRQLVKP